MRDLELRARDQEVTDEEPQDLADYPPGAVSREHSGDLPPASAPAPDHSAAAPTPTPAAGRQREKIADSVGLGIYRSPRHRMPFESRDGVYGVMNDVASNIKQALGHGHVAACPRPRPRPRTPSPVSRPRPRPRRSGSGVKPFLGFGFRGGGERERALWRVAARPRPHPRLRKTE